MRHPIQNMQSIVVMLSSYQRRFSISLASTSRVVFSIARFVQLHILAAFCQIVRPDRNSVLCGFFLSRDMILWRRHWWNCSKIVRFLNVLWVVSTSPWWTRYRYPFRIWRQYRFAHAGNITRAIQSSRRSSQTCVGWILLCLSRQVFQ